MRILGRLPIVFALAGFGLALAAGSSPQFQILKVKAEEQMANSPAYYNDVVHPQFYEAVMSRCVKPSLSDERAFEMIIEVDGSGRVAQTAFDKDTAVTRCLLENFSAMKLRPPPSPRYLAHFAIRFKN